MQRTDYRRAIRLSLVGTSFIIHNFELKAASKSDLFPFRVIKLKGKF
jgi:hypothetical protein